MIKNNLTFDTVEQGSAAFWCRAVKEWNRNGSCRSKINRKKATESRKHSGWILRPKTMKIVYVNMGPDVLFSNKQNTFKVVPGNSWIRTFVTEVTKLQKPESASELYRPSDRNLPAKLVSTFFVDWGCHVVSTTDPYVPYSRLSRPEPLHFLWNSSSVVLTRLSGPCSRPITTQVW
jgi:hypothetical protein